MRPSRKFSTPESSDDIMNVDMKEKQAKRAQRLQALADQTFDENEWKNKKNEFASKLPNVYVDKIKI